MFIATLIADDRASIHRSTVEFAQRRLSEIGCLTADIARRPEYRWLDEGKAVDIPFEGSLDRARSTLENGDLGAIDVVVQPAAGREKRLLVADMDSTMITVECIDELADYAGIKPQVAAVTEAAMRGELNFEGALDARVALLKGLDAGAIDRCLAERVRIMPGATALIRTMRARGSYTVLVSGGFTRFAEPVAREIGFDHAIANVLEIEGGVLTGRVAKPTVGAATKLATLEAALADHGLDRAASMAVGDGANDLPMVQAAGLGVAYRAKPIVAASAAARVDHGDLTALLYAQGIPRAEWVTA